MTPSTRMASVLALLLAFASTAHTETPTALVAGVDKFVLARMEKEKLPGLALALVSRGEVVAAKGYGLANVENRVPVTAESVFQSGSIGKQFTAVAVMLQVEDGKLALDDPLTKYFTDAPPTWRQIRVRHLLTHTSGIPDYTDDVDLRRDATEKELVHAAYRLPLEFEPGSRWRYSNTGYALLGFLIHKVSGRFYGDVLKDRVFAPLGMKTARIISEEDIVANRSAGYRMVNGELKNQEWVAPTLNTTADGSLYLTVLDFIAWDRGLRAHAILKPESWAQIYTPVTLKSGKTYPYGFGWFIDEAAGAPLYRHSGSWQGFNTYIARYLADDLTIVLLANRSGAGLDGFVAGIAAIVDTRLKKPPPAPIADRDPAITQHVRALLDTASKGTLSQADLPYESSSFFPDGPKAYAELLRPLGTLQHLDLVERTEMGDDRVFRYIAAYRDRKLTVQASVAPDDRLSALEIEPE